MLSTSLVLLTHAAVTLYMVGHHLVRPGGALPPARMGGADGFIPYSAAHGVLTTWLVVHPSTRGESGGSLGGTGQAGLLRTALWTVRGGLLLFLPWRAMARAEC